MHSFRFESNKKNDQKVKLYFFYFEGQKKHKKTNNNPDIVD